MKTDPSSRRGRSSRGPRRIALVVAALLGCGETVAAVPFERLGTTEEAPLVLTPGSGVSFAVYVARHSYSGKNHVLLDVALLKQGAVVASTRCQGFEMEGMSGSGCQTTHANRDCALRAPADGSDAVRITTRLEREGSFEYEGLEVRVQK